MLIFYFLLNKKIYEIYKYKYDIRKIFLALYEILKFVKYKRNANTSAHPGIRSLVIILKLRKLFLQSSKSKRFDQQEIC